MTKIKDVISSEDKEKIEKQKPELHDLIVQCVECKKPFLFTAGEQAFYQERGLAAPKRCPACRLKRRNQPRTGIPYQKVEVVEN